jgi:hypothetical protein
MLLALASAGRSSELNSLNCKYMKLQDSFIHFELPIHTKTCRSGSDNRKPSFQFHIIASTRYSSVSSKLTWLKLLVDMQWNLKVYNKIS